MNETISVPAPIRDITRLLGELENGDFVADANRDLVELLAQLEIVRIDQRGKPSGTLTITLSFTNDDGIIEIKADKKVTPPKKKRPKSIFWITQDNLLARQDPRQYDMQLRDVGGARRQVIDA